MAESRFRAPFSHYTDLHFHNSFVIVFTAVRRSNHSDGDLGFFLSN